MTPPVDRRPCIHFMAGACVASRSVQVGSEYYIEYQSPGATSHRMGRNSDTGAKILFNCGAAPKGGKVTPEIIAKQKRCEDYETY